MEFLNKSIQRYNAEFIKLICGSSVIFFILYRNILLLNIEIIQGFSFLERIIIVFVFSYILGKIIYESSNLITKITRWVLFQEDRKDFFGVFLIHHKDNLAFGKRPVVTNNRTVGQPETLIFINKTEILKNQLDDLTSEDTFWKCMNGISVFCGFLIQQKIELIGAVFVFSLCISLYCSSRLINFWSQCVTETVKSRNV